MSGNQDICDVNLDKLEKIGEGSFGKVYIWKDGKVLKVIDMTNIKPYMYGYITKTVTSELYALIKARQIMSEGVCLGFALLYDFAKCNDGNDENSGDNNIDVRIVLKHYPFTFEAGIGKLLRDSGLDVRTVWLNVMFKIWYAVQVMHKKMKIAHNDLDLNNIVFERDGTGNGTGIRTYDKYIVEGVEYCIPNIGLSPIIIDFGKSENLKSIKNRRKRDALMKSDYKFFFTENAGIRGEYSQEDIGGLIFRKNDLKEVIYKGYDVNDVIKTLGGRNSDIVRKVFADVRKKHPKLNGKPFMKKMKTEFAGVVRDNIELYKMFNKNLKKFQAVYRPEGIVKEFFKNLKRGDWGNIEGLTLGETFVLDRV